MHVDLGGRLIVAQDGPVMVRAALPVRLDTWRDGGGLGVVAVHQDDRNLAWPEINGGGVGRVFRGLPLNDVEPWQWAYAAPLAAIVVDGAVSAKMVGSEQEVLGRVLSEVWPHDVLDGESRCQERLVRHSVRRVTDAAALLRAYDDQARPAEWTDLEPGSTAHRDGPVFRIVGQSRRGFVAGPPDLGVEGAELAALITRQRDFFAERGEPVEWKTWSHDVPVDLPQRLEAAGFVADERETVLVGLAEDMTTPVEFGGVTVRETSDDADMRRIAATNTEVWGDDYG